MRKLLLIISALFFGALHAQTIHTVDNSPGSGADFTTIADAIDAANTGDTIFIHPSSTSYGDVSVTKQLHFVSMGHTPQYTQGMAAQLGNITLNVGATGANGITFSGLRFGQMSISNNNQSYNDLEITNCFFTKLTIGSQGPGTRNNWVIAGCVIQAAQFDAITRNNGAGWMIMNNHIRNPHNNTTWNLFRNLNGTDTFRNNIIVSDQGPDANGVVRIFEACTNLNIENSIFLFTDAVESIYLTGNSLTFNNCLTYSYAGSTLAALNGSSNLNNTEPNFVNSLNNPYFSTTKNFNIQAGASASGAGTDGQDLGIHGNSFSFSMFGYPSQFPIIRNMQILNAVVAPGGTLNVKIEAIGN
jgi:hypothetical protein